MKKIIITAVVVVVIGVLGYFFIGSDKEKSGVVTEDKSVQGYVVYGHEVRSFQPCGGNETLWLGLSSTTLQTFTEMHSLVASGTPAYTPIYGSLVGEIGEAPRDGFGADYEKSFVLENVKSFEKGTTCTDGSLPFGLKPKQASYVIENKIFTLVDGSAEFKSDSGSSAKEIVKVFTESKDGDLNADGINDRAVLLTYESGGSGTFFYVATAIGYASDLTSTSTVSKYMGTNGIVVGDRIAPQTIDIKNGEIVFNYSDRYPWESMTFRPSVGKSKYLILEGNILKNKVREILSEENAKNLAVGKWGDCGPDKCESLTVNILDGKDGVWYIEAIYGKIVDDSVEATKRIGSVHFAGGEWKFGTELVTEYKCKEGRGQAEFSKAKCK